MSTASEMAQKNEGVGDERENLAKEYAETVISIRQLEKKRDFLKEKLSPLLQSGERVGLVTKEEAKPLKIDEALLAVLKERFGNRVERVEANVTEVRKLMEENPDLDDLIPKGYTTKIVVG